jgi:uncharacterized membrane protein
MTGFRTTALSLIVVGVLAAGAAAGSHAYAQSTQPAQPAPAATAAPNAGGQVEKAQVWTRKKWKEMKAKWSQEKDKWADCTKKSKDQNLHGRKSWSFIASCMTS